MNGATAEPEVKTTRPPSRTRQITMGRSQNFFRSRMKDQSSSKNSPINTSLVSSKQIAASTLWDSAAYRLLLTGYFNMTAYRLLTSTGALNGMPVGAYG